MSMTVSQKLKIKEGDILLTINAPTDFKKELGDLPPNVLVHSVGKEYTQIHWFVMNRAQLEKELTKVLKQLKPGITVWVYYPKGSSKVQTDLTRDKGWDSLLSEGNKLTWISLVSFNDTWSVFGFRAKTEADKKKDVKPKEPREIFKWVNAATKEVTIPDDLAKSFKKNKDAQSIFDALAFSHKKEYIEWILTAKREETREKRITETIERLEKGWKNPANR
jgi:hypothetical protein